MPVSLLWAVDVYGRVYSLSTGGGLWEQCRDAHMEFKRVTAAQQCCWGIACDNNIYLNLHASDLPRWNPVDSFSDRLLPSDRWQWSDVTGLQHQPLDGFLLPSDSWEWEGDWHGWTYAIDFPAYYTKDKKWNSCVRRRRLLRYRKYRSMDTWAKVGQTVRVFVLVSPHSRRLSQILSATSATFSSCSVLSSFRSWTSFSKSLFFRSRRVFLFMDCSSWISTFSSSVSELRFFSSRTFGNLSFCCPILSFNAWNSFSKLLLFLTMRFIFIDICSSSGSQLGSLSASFWENFSSCSFNWTINCFTIFCELRCFSASSSFFCSTSFNFISIFESFSTSSLFSEGIYHLNPEGSEWEEVSLPGEVIQISCGPGDLVWAVLWEGQLLVWFRRGINSHNPCGSGWINMVGEMIMINVGLNDQVLAISSEDRAVYYRQGVTSSELSGKTWRAITVPRDGDRSHSSASASSLQSDVESERGSTDGAAGLVTSSSPESLVDAPQTNLSRPPASPKTAKDFQRGNSPAVLEEEPLAVEEDLKDPCAGVAIPPQDPQWCNVDLEEAQIQQTGVVLDSLDTCSLSSVATYTLAMEDPYGADERPLWAWVSGGGCNVDSHSQLNWFNSMNASSLVQSVQSMSLSVSPAQTAAWRRQIFEQLSERTKREMDDFRHYEQAIEQSVWVKKGTMQWWRDWKPYKWIDVHFALEQFSGAEGNKDGILFIYYNFYEEKKYLHAFVNDVTILVPVLNDSKHSFAIYTPERTKQRWPIRLSAATELEMQDWLALLSVSCCDSRGIQGPPSKQAAWSITCKGDIFVSEPSPMWGIGYDHTAWVHTGGYGGGFFQGLGSSTDNIYTQSDSKSVYIYENQRWNPVTGYTNRCLTGLWTTVCRGGRTETAGSMRLIFQRRLYHGHKTLKDFVRRRRWARKCKLTTTGPWQEVPPISLSDVTILPCAAQISVDVVPLWAISNKGDVLCRLGVSTQTPAGSSWLHVGTDQPFKSISIGAASQVWAIAKDGSAFYRGSLVPHPLPAKQKLKQVSVGRTSVYTVDENGNLWYRQGVTPSYPQGSSWEHISNNVRKVSVGPLDQVWIIADKVQGSHGLSCGTVCHRLGVQPMEPKGQSWDYGIGGGWDHITVRGNCMEPPRIRLPSLGGLASQSSFPVSTEANGNAVGC
ncbi:hypothetical protein F7725_014054 [Dissostichus mawsoni]|uniref:Tectonin beta-propeller repeat-containing protein 1 n=1 Tax=Dissostichus mawsoni TaxID=36200 RepID=A0A7J5YVC4_DISMA|nr:hypothetical protein F7725_014054 [Dissostichus mawsoni]